MCPQICSSAIERVQSIGKERDEKGKRGKREGKKEMGGKEMR